MSETSWPELRYDDWKDTLATLHMWTQVIGKVRLVQMPWTNHSWHVPLYVTTRGLTTSPIPHGDRTFELELDFAEHRLWARSSDRGEQTVELRPRTVADFYGSVMAALDALAVPVTIRTAPSEVIDGIPFDQDTTHQSYDPAAVERFFDVLRRVDQVLKRFRTGFLGKCSPVHFFWGSFDLAVTRFSGRPAPPHPGGVPAMPDWVAREAYSHEVSSAGFWPGGEAHPHAIFYSYSYPEPDGYRAADVGPAAAAFAKDLGEFVLPYDAVRTAPEPEDALAEFLTTTYGAAADLGGWDRAALECPEGWPR